MKSSWSFNDVPKCRPDRSKMRILPVWRHLTRWCHHFHSPEISLLYLGRDWGWAKMTSGSVKHYRVDHCDVIKTIWWRLFDRPDSLLPYPGRNWRWAKSTSGSVKNCKVDHCVVILTLWWRLFDRPVSLLLDPGRDWRWANMSSGSVKNWGTFNFGPSIVSFIFIISFRTVE